MTFLNRILTGVYAALILYISLNMILGEYGIAEKRRLKNYRAVLIENLEELESINIELNQKTESLQKESSTLQLYARNLEYYEKNEGVILFSGWEKEKNPYAMGKMMSWKSKSDPNLPLFRILSVCFGLITFLLLTLILPGKRNGLITR